MERNDQQAIEDLFAKLGEVERSAAPRDPEAEAFIRQMIGRQTGAPYYMAQTIIVQEQALDAAQKKIEGLEAERGADRDGAREQDGGLLSGLFGGDDGRTARPAASVPRVGRTSPLAGDEAAPYRQQPRGGGFLAGAAQTAMGVAGGVLLGSAIGSLFGGNEAQASQAADGNAADQVDDGNARDASEDANVEDAGYDDAGFDDGGGFDDTEI